MIPPPSDIGSATTNEMKAILHGGASDVNWSIRTIPHVFQYTPQNGFTGRWKMNRSVLSLFFLSTCLQRTVSKILNYLPVSCFELRYSLTLITSLLVLQNFQNFLECRNSCISLISCYSFVSWKAAMKVKVVKELKMPNSSDTIQQKVRCVLWIAEVHGPTTIRMKVFTKFQITSASRRAINLW